MADEELGITIRNYFFEHPELPIVWLGVSSLDREGLSTVQHLRDDVEVISRRDGGITLEYLKSLVDNKEDWVKRGYRTRVINLDGERMWLYEKDFKMGMVPVFLLRVPPVHRKEGSYDHVAAEIGDAGVSALGRILVRRAQCTKKL